MEERTWRGVSKLKKQLLDTKTEAEAHHTSLHLHGRSVAVNYNAMAKAQLPKILFAARTLEDMAECIQPALGREVPGLSHMGVLLAQSVRDSGITSLYAVHARNLVNITEENGISPWETKELQELFSI